MLFARKGKTKDTFGGDGGLSAVPLGGELTVTQFSSSGRFAGETLVLSVPISFRGSRPGWEKLAQWYIPGYIIQQLWK